VSESVWLAVVLAALALSVAVNVWLVLRVVRPLRQLSNCAKQLAGGNFAALQQPMSGTPEVEALRHTMSSMAQHVRRSQDEALAVRYALTEGLEAERQRLAHELHDDTVQALVAVAQSIDLATQWIGKEPERAVPLLKASREQAVESVGGLRRLIANLRPPALEELGLIPALRMLGQDEPALTIRVETAGAERRLDASLELALFRVAQEAIHNAWRHGGATEITLNVGFYANRLTLSARDNGKGFSPPKHFDVLARDAHYGLLGMQERVANLNGTLSITSEPGCGAEVRVDVPLQRIEQPAASVRDPVCGAVIEPDKAYGSVEHDGQRHYFCCPVCQGAFRQNPNLYLAPH
jgi:signal transduction histidine kinase/YHS domain-containing protein